MCIKFFVGPAEGGAAAGEGRGAEDGGGGGVLENTKESEVLGVHVNAALERGRVAYRPGRTMATWITRS